MRHYFSQGNCAILIASSVLLTIAGGATSCIDSKYDLNKDIDLTVDINGEGLSVPLGYTDKLTLGSVIEESETLLKGEDGTYSISKKDNIDPVKIDIEDPTIKIDNPTFDAISVEFEDKKVRNVSIPQQSSHSTVSSTPQADVNITNLPTIQGQEKQETLIDNSFGAGITIPLQSINISDKQTISMSYTDFPDDVKNISEVYFGNDNKGQAVEFTINTEDVVNALSKGTQTVEEFKITFPEGFVITKDGNFPGTVNGNTFVQSNTDITGETTYKFYVQKVKFPQALSGSINYKGDISYNLKYKLSDAVTNGNATKGASVKVKMNDIKFAFNKATINTNDIAANFDSESININTNIDNLSDIQHVYNVEFTNSNINLNINVNKDNLPLNFVGGGIEIALPKSFEIGQPSNSNVTLSNNVLTLPATALNSPFSVSLPIHAINIDKDVVNDQITLNETVTYKPTANGILLRGDNLSTDLLKQTLSAAFDINVVCGNNGEMTIANSKVKANSVEAEINNNTSFEVNNHVDKAIKAIKTVTFTEPAALTFNIKMQGFPVSEIKNGILFDNVKINLPKFISFAQEDGIVDGILTLNEEFNPAVNPTFKKTLHITGMDFTQLGNEYQNGISLTNGTLYISEELAKVSINGSIRTKSGEIINSENLNSFTVVPSITIPEMKVNAVVGKFDPEIEDVSEVVALNLGDDLDFLKEEGTTLDINNPQLKIELTNTVGVPVDITLNIKGTDKNGNAIEGSDVIINLTDGNGLAPAKENGEAVTTVFMLSKLGTNVANSEDGKTVYRNIKVENLSNLTKRIPDNVDIHLTAEVNQNSDHSANLSKELEITGNYDVIVPLAFDNLDITYSDVIDNLQDEAGDILQKAVKAEFIVTCDVLNTIPIGMNISAKALDAEGNELPDVDVVVLIDGQENGLLEVPATENEAATSAMEIHIVSVDKQLQKLDKIEWTVNAIKNSEGAVSTTGGATLNADQYIQIKNMKATIKGLSINLN